MSVLFLVLGLLRHHRLNPNLEILVHLYANDAATYRRCGSCALHKHLWEFADLVTSGEGALHEPYRQAHCSLVH